jgi:hypothetical protein
MAVLVGLRLAGITIIQAVLVETATFNMPVVILLAAAVVLAAVLAAWLMLLHILPLLVEVVAEHFREMPISLRVLAAMLKKVAAMAVPFQAAAHLPTREVPPIRQGGNPDTLAEAV